MKISDNTLVLLLDFNVCKTMSDMQSKLKYLRTNIKEIYLNMRELLSANYALFLKLYVYNSLDS